MLYALVSTALVWLVNCLIGVDVQVGDPKMTAKKRSLRKIFWVEVIVLLVIAIPVVAWAGAIAANVAPVWNGLSVTEPTALTLLGGSLISVSFLIRRFKL